MRRIKLFILAVISVFIGIFTVPAYANMAAPKNDDLASGISFEKNNALRVLSEVLDIKIKGAMADIKATYNMKNIKDTTVSTKSMFISPNIDGNTATVLMNGSSLSFTSDSYYVDYNTTSRVDGWRFVVENPGDESEWLNKVDAITFDMEFKPNEEATIEVSYQYRLGGYPDYDFDVKRGSLTYYLSPANMWEDYGGITINLELSPDMPVIKKSSIEFEKLSKYKYQYKSDTLPVEELTLSIDQNGWQEFTSQFNSPYLAMNIAMLLPIILIAVVGIVIIIIIIVRTGRKRKKKGNSKEL